MTWSLIARVALGVLLLTLLWLGWERPGVAPAAELSFAALLAVLAMLGGIVVWRVDARARRPLRSTR